MDRTFGEEDLRGVSKPTEAGDLSARRPWVKPALERLSLKDARSGLGPVSDGPAGGSMS
jgi:hypothetical protein